MNTKKTDTGKKLIPQALPEELSRRPPDAGGGLYSRRRFIGGGAVGLVSLATAARAAADRPKSWLEPGGEFTNYGQPGPDQKNVIRWISAEPALPGNGVSWTPLHDMEGTITPNGLHFERHHNGVPQIESASWELVIHGLVERSLAFDLDALHRYPLQSKIAFIECGGNSNSLWYPTPVQSAAGYMHGLLSCSEWTGVPLASLLAEAGVQSDAKWLVADGLDGSGVTVSLPLEKVLDDTLVALYQNGEPLRVENGYPARLLVPGWEGVRNLKWLRSLQITDKPLMSRFDTVSYTDLLKDGTAERFSFEMEVKSFITSPSPGQTLTAPGFYEIRGLAGRSFTFKDRPGFLDVQTAYRARPNEVTDEWRLDITAGLDVRPNLQILSQAFAISTPKPGSDTTIPYKSLKLQPSIVYRASESLSYQFGGFATLSGEYALAERGLFIGLWKTY
jgi:sulfane dehydrogenase subunit SoxC